MKTRLPLWALALALILLTVSVCSHASRSYSAGKKIVNVTNHNWSDVDVYFYCDETQDQVERAIVTGETRRVKIRKKRCADLVLLIVPVGSRGGFTILLNTPVGSFCFDLSIENHLPLTTYMPCRST